MSPKNSRIVYTTITCIILFILLISNLGSNFKTDILSYSNIDTNVNTIKSNWLSSKNLEGFNKTMGTFLSSQIRDYSISPYTEFYESENLKSYTQEFTVNVPITESSSYIEVISKNGNTIKKYGYGKDFTEDVSGLFSARNIIGESQISNELEFKSSIPDIVLMEEYNSNSNYNKKDYDQKLLALGINAVIFPSSKESILEETSFRDSDYIENENGLLKFAVSYEAYNNIVSHIKNGSKLKLKSGLKIKKQVLNNVYGKIQGSNDNYKPLIIASFYDGEIPSEYKNSGAKNFEPYTYTTSILLECARMIKLQENFIPDRTIIFAFLGGKSLDEKGLEAFRSLNIEGDLVLLDNLGNADKFNLNHSKNINNFSNTIKYFSNKNDLKIVSSTTEGNLASNFLYLYGINNTGNGLQFDNAYNTCKFVLSFIEDECYSLDFLTGNSREIRSIRRTIKDYTPLISLCSLIFITFVVFKYPEIKDSN